MKNMIRFLFVGAVIGFVMISCSKTGATGPAGPAGPDSVYSSPWMNLQFDGSVDNGTGDSIYDKLIAAPSITQAILDSGIVLSYIKTTDQAGDIFVKDVSSLPQFFYDDFSVGSIYITSFDTYQGIIPFRYVSIPGKLISGSGINRKVKGYTPGELKDMPYEKVMQILTN